MDVGTRNKNGSAVVSSVVSLFKSRPCTGFPQQTPSSTDRKPANIGVGEAGERKGKEEEEKEQEQEEEEEEEKPVHSGHIRGTPRAPRRRLELSPCSAVEYAKKKSATDRSRRHPSRANRVGIGFL